MYQKGKSVVGRKKKCRSGFQVHSIKDDRNDVKVYRIWAKNWGLWKVIMFRWGYKGRGPIIETPWWDYKKRMREKSSFSLPCEDTVRNMHLKTRKTNSIRNPIWWHFGHLNSRTMRNKYQLFKFVGLWYFVIAVQGDGDIHCGLLVCKVNPVKWLSVLSRIRVIHFLLSNLIAILSKLFCPVF